MSNKNSNITFFVPAITKDPRFSSGRLWSSSQRFVSGVVSGAGGGGGSFDNLYSVELDGISEYIQLPDNANLNKVRSQYTLSLWYKLLQRPPNTSRQIFNIMGAGNNGTGRLQFNNDLNSAISNGVQFFPSSTVSSIRSTSSTFYFDKWHHIACVFDGSQSTNSNKVELYIDGEKTSSYMGFTKIGTYGTASSANFSSEGNNTIGISNTMKCRIDQFVFMDVSLSASVVKTFFNSGSVLDPTTIVNSNNIVAWWRLGSGTISGSGDSDNYPILYSSINNITGTAINMEADDLKVLDPAGPEVFATSSYSISFNGIDQHISATHARTITTSKTAFHLNFWAKFNQFGNGVARNVCQRMRDDTAIAYLLQTDDATQGELKFFVSSSAYWVRTVGAGLQTGTWYNIAVNYDGNTLDSSDRANFYVNGVKTGRTANLLPTGTYAPLLDVNVFLAHTGSGAIFNGNMADFSVFHLSKSDNEILSYYNSGVPTNKRMDAGIALYFRPTQANYDSFPVINDYGPRFLTGTLANMTIGNYVIDVP